MRDINKALNLLLILLICFQLVSCGTILYPQRRNQEVGRIDVGVALLDGFWLLAGLIPGIVAFAVDFSTGAIYLPKHDLGKSGDGNYHVVRFNPATTTQKQIEEIISRETGQAISFSDERLELTRVRNMDELPAYFAALNP